MPKRTTLEYAKVKKYLLEIFDEQLSHNYGTALTMVTIGELMERKLAVDGITTSKRNLHDAIRIVMKSNKKIRGIGRTKSRIYYKENDNIEILNEDHVELLYVCLELLGGRGTLEECIRRGKAFQPNLDWSKFSDNDNWIGNLDYLSDGNIEYDGNFLSRTKESNAWVNGKYDWHTRHNTAYRAPGGIRNILDEIGWEIENYHRNPFPIHSMSVYTELDYLIGESGESGKSPTQSNLISLAIINLLRNLKEEKNKSSNLIR